MHMQDTHFSPAHPALPEPSGPTIIERGILTALSLIFITAGVLLVASGSGILPEGIIIAGG